MAARKSVLWAVWKTHTKEDQSTVLSKVWDKDMEGLFP